RAPTVTLAPPRRETTWFFPEPRWAAGYEAARNQLFPARPRTFRSPPGRLHHRDDQRRARYSVRLRAARGAPRRSRNLGRQARRRPVRRDVLRREWAFRGGC